MVTDRELLLALHFVGALLALPVFLTVFDLRRDVMLALAIIAAAIWPLTLPALLIQTAWERR